MRILLRLVCFGVISAGAVWADQAYQRPQESAVAAAAVAQVNNPAAAQNLEALRQRATWADLATGGGILVAAVACFGTMRLPPSTRVVDHRKPALQKESV